jgi:hypothetical protein
MTYEILRRPFILRLAQGQRRIIAIERHAGITFLITDQGGAINHHLMMQMIRNGTATFDVEPPPEPIRIKLTVDKATLERLNHMFADITEKLGL